jgi:hypothetical protein
MKEAEWMEWDGIRMTEAEWLECDEPQTMLPFVCGQVTARKRRLLAASLCRHVLHLTSGAKRPARLDGVFGGRRLRWRHYGRWLGDGRR